MTELKRKMNEIKNEWNIMKYYENKNKKNKEDINWKIKLQSKKRKEGKGMKNGRNKNKERMTTYEKEYK